jgi:hypothetical protein
MDVCLCLFCVCTGIGLAMGWSPVQGVLPTVLGLRNWSETKRFTDDLCSKVGGNRKEREGVVNPNLYFLISCNDDTNLVVRSTGLDFVHRPLFYKLENTMFRKVILFPSSDEVGRQLLCCFP